jgi:Cytochrome C and Quinol oxidase polypeptide I
MDDKWIYGGALENIAVESTVASVPNSAFFLNIGPDQGWFSYVPLAGPEFSPGKRVDFWVQMVTFTEIAALAVAVEIIVTVLKQRAPGMSLNRIPLFVWAMPRRGPRGSPHPRLQTPQHNLVGDAGLHRHRSDGVRTRLRHLLLPDESGGPVAAERASARSVLGHALHRDTVGQHGPERVDETRGGTPEPS